MLLNFGKCKCIHIGHGNMGEEYKMGDAVLGRTTQENDLGVTFSGDMKVRGKLANTNYCLTDDLTQEDVKEKQAYAHA